MSDRIYCGDTCGYTQCIYHPNNIPAGVDPNFICWAPKEAFADCSKAQSDRLSSLASSDYEPDPFFGEDDEDDDFFGFPGVDPDREAFLDDIGEDPWGGRW